MAALAVAERQVVSAVRTKPADFFKEICRCLPWVLKNYKLEELITTKQLRRNISDAFRKNANVTTPQVIDLLVFKGREELEMVMLQHKQRHHLITTYVAPYEQREIKKVPVGSAFLESFYAGNYS